MSQRTRVRFAPSPTGFLHIGGLRTALYNELLACREGGDFILRIEDTDRTRFVEGGIENICRSLKNVGVEPNEGVWITDDGAIIQRGEHGPYIQSERRTKHVEYAMELIKMDKAYPCFCTTQRLEELRETQQLNKQPTMYDGHCRSLSASDAQQRIEAGEPYVIRLKLPKSGKISVWDIIRDEVIFDWSLIDDQVIIKSDGYPTYHLAAICDDHDMEITHVIRGEEWLASTPKHLFIFAAFGWEPPKYAHLPLLLNADRSKLSKRQNDVAVEDYLSNGYLPDALINFVALLGWNPTADREIYTHDELRQTFDIAKVNKSGAVFNLEKLTWINGEYLKSMPTDAYLALTRPFVTTDAPNERIDASLILVRDRIQFPKQAAELIAPYLAEHLTYDGVSITWKTQPAAEAVERLRAVRDLLTTMNDADVREISKTETAIKSLIAERGWGNGDTLWPLRVALSGAEKSPTPFDLLAIYGKEMSLARITDAIAKLGT